jgi:hypothetical protein
MWFLPGPISANVVPDSLKIGYRADRIVNRKPINKERFSG